MSIYTKAFLHGSVSMLVTVALMFLVLVQGSHWFSGPLVFSIWGAWYSSLFLFRCPNCRRSVYAYDHGIPTGGLPVKKCTKCGTDLTIKASAEKGEASKEDK